MKNVVMRNNDKQWVDFRKAEGIMGVFFGNVIEGDVFNTALKYLEEE